MFRRRCCNPYRRWLGVALIALGFILLVICLPAKFWLALLGVGIIFVGISLLRC
ncbi:MAG: intracellular growth attenuator family protein [Clostridiales bacterium]|nr:intracellular growth attenuator family protein [Clostridiales bacterium]